MFGIEIVYVIAGAILGFFANKTITENKPRNRPRLAAKFPAQELPPARTPEVLDSDVETPLPPVWEPAIPCSANIQDVQDIQDIQPDSPASGEDAIALKEKLKQTELAYQMAQEMSLFKGGFLSRASHELRSPLSSLIGLHQLIISDLCENPEEEREFIVEANKSALKLVKLLDELIAVAKFAHGTGNSELQAINLRDLLQEVHDLTHLQATNRSLRLHLALPPATVFVTAEPRRLRQVLVNLVDRAILQMQSGGIRISVEVEETSASGIIWIDADCDPQAWAEPIDLLNSPAAVDTSEKFSPGLNLLLSQTLLEAMAGKLEVVEAESPEITRVQCSIPLSPFGVSELPEST